MVKLQFLAQFPVDHLAYPVMSGLILFLCYLLIMWLIVSSLSPHNLHLFCCVLSILVLIWLVFMALFWAAIRRDSVSLLRFLFLSQVHVFSCEMLLVSRLKHPLSCFSFQSCFSDYCHSADPRVVSIVFGGCNQSSSTLLLLLLLTANKKCTYLQWYFSSLC